MATVKRTATIGEYFLELGNKEIEIYRIAQDGSGTLKRIDDIQGTIRMIAEEYGIERDYNMSFRQHVARLIQHINTLENKQQ
ncbi:MAG: hypothetical protein IIU90_06350 [Bacteroidaceae bacterium]|jgi:hypothetical protein|nr:hypothetical protein [Bacteroidaceae bacterium]MBQ5617354.1 hypothetical protein [Bacteroidaceae bacterium]